jgi:hypothetical protein
VLLTSIDKEKKREKLRRCLLPVMVVRLVERSLEIRKDTVKGLEHTRC